MCVITTYDIHTYLHTYVQCHTYVFLQNLIVMIQPLKTPNKAHIEFTIYANLVCIIRIKHQKA